MAATSSTSTSTLTPTPLTGACFCKALRFRLAPATEADCTLSAFCHCSKCQLLNGAPFVWTTHWVERAVRWLGPASGPSPLTGNKEGDQPLLLPNKPDLPASMATFNTMPGRKWKIRCATCGTPMGSWNEAKREWTLWPTTLDRPSGNGQAGEVGSVRDITAWFRPTHHMFYGGWRAVDVLDGLPRYIGYEANSERVQ
ncbi:hypothetical protein OC834_002534 [Tilletia horrida]|uniref:CENP-V/GFA domain-containing protein n=1 Tax=Tilletia horrida TaxID=155126 RepID=A0AAN6GGQ7_9BASI|nr:hypothetical protein OC834_002534 [Tilletia horrida]KAK0539757.1 hypothetical protein OC842_000797 [Tilletia horrida]